MPKPTISMKKLRAIEEALVARLADAIEVEDLDRPDYEAALALIEAEIEALKKARVEVEPLMTTQIEVGWFGERRIRDDPRCTVRMSSKYAIAQFGHAHRICDAHAYFLIGGWRVCAKHAGLVLSNLLLDRMEDAQSRGGE